MYLTPYDTGSAGENYAFEAPNGYNELNRDAVVASALKHGYIAGIQLHKTLRLP